MSIHWGLPLLANRLSTHVSSAPLIERVITRYDVTSSGNLVLGWTVLFCFLEKRSSAAPIRQIISLN